MRYRKPMTTTTQLHASSRKLIDFPCSYSWRAYYAETMDGIILPPLEPKETHEDIPLPKIPPEHRLFDRLQQLEGRFIHLENKVNEKRDASKKKEVYTIEGGEGML